MKLVNRLRLAFDEGRPVVVPAPLHATIWGDVPKVHGVGTASGLFMPVSAECGCRGTVSLGEYVDGETLELGWWVAVTHNVRCEGVRG